MNRLRTLVVSALCAVCLVVYAAADAGFAGKWEGTTPSGRQVALDFAVKGSELTGTLTLAQQTVEITEGTVEEKTCSFKATVDGRTPKFSGRLVGEELELTVEDAQGPVMFKRVK